MDKLTQQLAAFAASLRYEDIPAAVLSRARQSLVDTLGCAFGGQGCEAARIALNIADGAVPVRGAGRVLGSRVGATAQEAAFINTAMIRYLDFNDSWHAGHPSDIIGGLLAVAESAGADGKRLLTAMVAAYEVVFSLIPPTQMREKGWDQGFCVGLATVCGLGHLMGMDQARIGHALAIAAVANVPMRATRAGNLSLWKGSATAFAVRNAVYATQFAAGGMTGPEKPFEGRHGLMEQITGPFEIDAFPAAGGNWLLPWVRLKYWPVEYNAQAGVWAALKLREQVSIEARYLDPSMRPLMAKIAVSEDPGISALFPHKIVMRVAAVSTDGSRVEIETGDPRGDSTNPMGDREIDAKFSLLAEPVLGSAGSTRALEVWRDIDAASALSGSMATLVC